MYQNDWRYKRNVWRDCPLGITEWRLLKCKNTSGPPLLKVMSFGKNNEIVPKFASFLSSA